MIRPSAHPITATPARIGFGRLGLQAWVVLFVGAAGTTLSAAAHLRPIIHLIWILPILFLALRVRPRLPASVMWSIAGVLAAYGVASLASRVPWMSMETAGFAAAVAAWFVVAAAMREATRSYVARAILIALVAWVGAIGAVWFVGALTWLTAVGWPPPGEQTRSYVWLAANSIPVVVLVATPFVAWLSHEPMDRWLARGFVAVGVTAVALSGGALGAAGVAVAIAAYLGIRALKTRRQAMVAGAGVVSAAALLAALAANPSVTLPSTVEARLVLWQQGIRMLMSDFTTGTGPGTTALVRREFLEPHAGAVLTDHLHSVPVQAAAEGGLLLLGALVVASITWGRSLWMARHIDPDRTRIVAACFAGAAVTFLGDSFFDLPVVVALVITVAAWSITPDRSSGTEHPRPPRARSLSPIAMRAMVAGLALVSLAPVVSADTARMAAAGGRVEARNGNWTDALERFESAVAWNPANPVYRLESGEAARQLGDTDLARRRFSEAVSMAPSDGRTWGALASVTAAPEERVELLATAAERADGDGQFAFRLGMELERAGRASAAIDAYAEAVALDPALIVALPSRPTDQPISRDDVMDRLPEVTARLGRVARLDTASIRWDLQLLTGALDPQAPPAWQAVAAAIRGDSATAEAELAEAREDSPTDARTWQAAAAVARLRCAVEAEEAALQLERMLASAHQFQSVDRRRAWERMYREEGLGDYQPGGLVPADERWPEPFVQLARDCP